MKLKLLTNTFRSYVLIFLCGILAGVVTRLTDFCSMDSLWSIPSIATLYGFWIISVTAIVLLSTSNLCAGISSFLYLFGMTLSFYGFQYILGIYLPMFDNGGFKTSLFLLYSILSVTCGIGAFALFYWDRNTKISAVLYALPIGALLAEAFATGIYLFQHATFLFQFLMDLFAALSFGLLFHRKTAHKVLYYGAAILVATAVYCMVYRSYL